jgi:hypothetical protein
VIRSSASLTAATSRASCSPWHGILWIENPSLPQGGQNLPHITCNPWNHWYSVPANLIFHPTTDAAAYQQLHFELYQPSSSQHPGNRCPVLVLEQLIFPRELHDDHQSRATINYRGYTALMFGNGEFHSSTYGVPYIFRAMLSSEAICLI